MEAIWYVSLCVCVYVCERELCLCVSVRVCAYVSARVWVRACVRVGVFGWVSLCVPLCEYFDNMFCFAM
jgi:hypothetical protein